MSTVYVVQNLIFQYLMGHESCFPMASFSDCFWLFLVVCSGLWIGENESGSKLVDTEGK